MEKTYDIVIIGGGPAGLAAGLYAGRATLDAVIIEKSKVGGQIVTTEEVANVPGSVRDASGPSLIARMVEQSEEFGSNIVKDTVTELKLDGHIKEVICEKETYKAKAVIYAAGAKPRLLGVPGEKEFTGKGVSYCATCDGAFFEDMEVFVVGGGDSAVEEAMFLTNFARKVYLLSRDPELTCAKSIQEKVFNNEKIEIKWNTEIKEIKGDGIVESIVLYNRETKEESIHEADEEDGTFGVFIFIGYVPQTNVLKDILELDHGYIKTDDRMATGVDGLFAAGDCRVKPLRQVVTAASDGAIAAVSAEKYIEHLG
ncbi:thioredoxin-disulfide reductase [Abyssisolibacter fermentans]|uniref:thioredoxin-disulfide reductase n=1 Tax=Abyssisolibacter fermentans TaxID=1766203 RepID=UPI00083697F5|nr:thioredoxin-disulfide reductase [Abyssisolibacter fermentans]